MLEICLIIMVIAFVLFLLYLIYDLRKYDKRSRKKNEDYMNKLLEIAHNKFECKELDANEFEIPEVPKKRDF